MPHFGEFLGVATTSYGIVGASAWNPADRDADVVLSSGNRVAAVTAALGAVRGTRSRSGGKYQFEVQCNDANVLIGFGLASAAILNSFPGLDANGWAYYGTSGQKWNAGAGAAYGATWTAGDTIGVLYDNGSIRFYKNGVDQGAAFAGVVGALFPMFGPGTSGAGTRSCNLNTGGAPFLFPVAGYSPWG